ncbi:heterokaryon incompatibility protein-domain-containing protein [Rhexocercosporidium sp. MPI-PUGE-AT-0058]|nr:heterokaryon incompatibility protein-domain-containing protein [Rhexocercosporidium sp. MPI-PUGE-AT-0058]
MPRPKRKRGVDSPPRFSYSSPTYEHEPLPTTTSIRILELFPGEGTEIIKCSLSVSERETAPPFEAISYAWGSGTNTRVISCENRKLKVTTNLRDALWKIRDPVKSRLLWADAVCINQNDINERGYQVWQMSEIYASATRVLVWLDLPNPKSGDFEYLFDDDSIGGAAESEVSSGGRRGALRSFVERLDSIQTHHEERDPEIQLIANTLGQLFDSPWFTRLWVIQEVGMAKSVQALVGSTKLDFVDLIRIILKLERRTLLMDQLGLLTAGIANVFTTFPARSKELAGEVDAEYDFLELLEVTRAHKASDSRDYVYALLGHPSAKIGDKPVAVPDYKKSPDDLFFQVSLKILEQTKDLRLLSAIHGRDGSILSHDRTSWTPSWSRDAGVLSMGLYRDRYYDVLYNASAGMPCIAEVTMPGKVLQVRGFVLDEIEEYTSTENPDKKSGLTVPKSIHDLLTTALNFTSVKKSTKSKVATLKDIGQTITAGFRNQALPRFEADFAAFSLHIISTSSSSLKKTMTATLAPVGLPALRKTAEKGSLDEIYWATSRFCTGRKLFSTREGRTGLGPEILKRGDLCCVLFGACVPIVLRPVEEGYKLVGEAYVQGVMMGEAVTDLERGGLYEEQSFEIV